MLVHMLGKFQQVFFSRKIFILFFIFRLKLFCCVIALKSKHAKEIAKPCAALGGAIHASLYGMSNNLLFVKKKRILNFKFVLFSPLKLFIKLIFYCFNSIGLCFRCKLCGNRSSRFSNLFLKPQISPIQCFLSAFMPTNYL